MATDVLREAKKRVVPLSVRDPSISPEICRIVERAMAYHPHARFSSYDELIASLETAISHLQFGRPEGADSAAVRRAEKKRRERIAVIAGVLAFFVLSVLLIARGRRPKPQPIVETPAPVVLVTPPLAPDASGDIAKSYRQARAAMAAKDYEKAAQEFVQLHHNPAVQEPTRSWTGVEAVLATMLHGRTADARKLALEALQHAQSLPPDTTPVSGALLATLQQLEQLPPLPSPATSGTGASPVIAAMLAGLKNWEQGMPDQAAACFTAVLAITLPPDDPWVAIYQDLARDYLADYQILSGPLFSATPADKAACDALIGELDALLPAVKTRGRMKFDVRAWQLDLTRQAKLAASVKPAPAEDGSAAPK